MIKCRICSCQCDNWYVPNWRQTVNVYWGLNPPNEDAIQSKQKPCWFLVYCYHDVSSISCWNNPKILSFSNKTTQKHNWRTGDPCYINYFATSREYRADFWCAENLWTWRGGCGLSLFPPTPEPTSLSQWAPNHLPTTLQLERLKRLLLMWGAHAAWRLTSKTILVRDQRREKKSEKKKCFEVTDLRLMILHLQTFRFFWLNCTATKFLHVLIFYTLASWVPGFGLPLVMHRRVWLRCCNREGKFQKTSNQVRQHDIE